MAILTPTRINRLLSKQDQILNAGNAGRKFSIFPFNIVLGTANSSEIGITTENYDPADFGSFEKVFSGRDSVLVVWDNSTFAEKKQPNDTFLTKTFQVGS